MSGRVEITEGELSGMRGFIAGVIEDSFFIQYEVALDNGETVAVYHTALRMVY